ncbi:MAG TPA: hypothetical protein VI382_06620, partial [Candidatus Manganitrophaceae bacterium]|nr:hypothetical protein [Candidatus Manganitrophaceae bacterium]
MALVTLVLLLTATLGWLAYHSSRSIIEYDAIRAVGISANAREQTLLRVLRRHQDRAGRFLKTTVLICKDRAGKEACLRRELDQFLSTEGAVSAGLSVPGIAPILVDKESFSTEDREASPPDQLAVFARDRRGRPFYSVRAESENGGATLLLRFDMSGINAIFLDHYILDEYGLGKSGETFLVDSKGFFMTSSRYPGGLDKNLSINSKAIQACLAGADGESLGRNNLGVEVIHGFRYVEE